MCIYEYNKIHKSYILQYIQYSTTYVYYSTHSAVYHNLTSIITAAESQSNIPGTNTHNPFINTKYIHSKVKELPSRLGLPSTHSGANVINPMRICIYMHQFTSYSHIHSICRHTDRSAQCYSKHSVLILPPYNSQVQINTCKTCLQDFF